MGKTIKISDYIMQFLAKKGVTEIFMLPGGGAMHMVDSLGASEIHYTCFQHEQGAAIAAEAYGQHTNNPGVVLVTSGPGATNAITGVTAGWIDSTPMFILSGQAKRSDLIGDTGVRQIGSQEVQIIDMVKPITKYAVQIMRPEEVRYHLKKAWYEATTKRPGPVWLSIPLDVQGAVIDMDTMMDFSAEERNHGVQDCETAELSDAIRKTAELIGQSKKPLFLAGNGIKISNSTKQFRKLVKKTGIPVQTTWKAIDMFGEEEAQYFGHPGIMGDRGANLLLQNADLLISIGSRIDTSITAFNEENFAKNAKKILVDIDSHELERMQFKQVEMKLPCDAGLFIETLSEEINRLSLPDFKNWVQYGKQLRERYPVVQQQHRDKTEAVSAYYFIEKLCQRLTGEDIIVPESSGGAGEITYQAFQIKYGQKMKNAAGLGSMGFGLPYAIGASIANHNKRTILINGDGAFQLNIQELETLRRLNLPVKIFIWNNHGYASIRSMQKNNFNGRLVASNKESGFTTPNILKVAEAYGFRTYRIENTSNVEKGLQEILQDDQSCVCEILVRPEETVAPRVKATVREDGSMISGTLENMWPLIEVKE